jgi:hypothetical protein
VHSFTNGKKVETKKEWKVNNKFKPRHWAPAFSCRLSLFQMLQKGFKIKGKKEQQVQA